MQWRECKSIVNTFETSASAIITIEHFLFKWFKSVKVIELHESAGNFIATSPYNEPRAILLSSNFLTTFQQYIIKRTIRAIYIFVIQT